MPISKDLFCTIIRELEASEELEDNIADLIQKYNNLVRSDFPERYGLVLSHAFRVVDLLAIIMDDDADDIYNFCYNYNFGKTMIDNYIEGLDVVLDTPEKLYDFLESEHYRKEQEVGGESER